MTTTPWHKLPGQTLGTSEWFHIDQQRIDLFADATLDHQFIHVDPKAAANTPYGGTIAHGLLTLSLLPQFLYAMLAPYQTAHSTFINYGTDKVRFINPVRCDSDIRCQATVSGCEQKESSDTLLSLSVTVEIRGEQKPALVADVLMLIVDQNL